MEPVTSARGSLGKDFWEDYKEATIGLTYSTTSDISRVKHTLGALVVCIIQVEGFYLTEEETKEVFDVTWKGLPIAPALLPRLTVSARQPSHANALGG